MNAIDTATSGLRMRIGSLISRVDRLPHYGRLLLLLDAEAVAWARSSVTLPPDPMVIDRIASGRQSPLDFSIPGTRHLVIYLQSMLSQFSDRDHAWQKRKQKIDVLMGLCSALANYNFPHPVS